LSRAARWSYTGIVNWRLAALLIGLAGVTQAQNVYKIYVPHAGPISKVEWSSPGAGWTVTVGFDRERCELYCAYRRVRDDFGPLALTHFLPPPATVIRVYGDPGSEPDAVTVDPAGVRFPRARGRESAGGETLGIPTRGLFAGMPERESGHAPAVPRNELSNSGRIVRALPAAAPLRI
jgi:hypothetical protein